MAKRRKRGRPATGHDPIVGTRLPAPIVRQIDKMAAEIGADRSIIMRLLVEHALEHGPPKVRIVRSGLVSSLLGWKGRGRTADKIVAATIGNLKAQAAAYLAARKGTKTRHRRADVIEEVSTRHQLRKT